IAQVLCHVVTQNVPRQICIPMRTLEPFKRISADTFCRDATVLGRDFSPAVEGKTMNAIWTFADGHLAAHNDVGDLLQRRSANEAMGRGLALRLNQASGLILRL
ncbi:hypothetical protein, partial [Simplicispira metamorpha]